MDDHKSPHPNTDTDRQSLGESKADLKGCRVEDLDFTFGKLRARLTANADAFRATPTAIVSPSIF